MTLPPVAVPFDSEAEELEDFEEEEEIKQLYANPKNLSVTYQYGEISERKMLDGLPFNKFKAVILMSYSDRLEPQQADSQTLITLLHLRDIADKNGYTYSIVSEMMDIRNRRLAAITRADDFVISNRMISLLMAQISEEKRLAPVFTDIFDPEGSEIYLKPAANYIQPGETVNFYTVVEAARRQGHTAIGYRIRDYAHDAARAYGVVINPNKSEPITFSEKDKVIVFAED